MSLKTKNIFRQEALAEQSVPQRLETAVRVISPSGWLALFCLGLLTAAMMAWVIFGGIAYTVNGQGMLLREGQVYDILSIGAGQLTKIFVREGDTVKKGQLIAKISQPEILKQIDAKKERLAELAANSEELSTVDQESYQLKRTFLQNRTKILHEMVRKKSQQLDFYQQKIVSQNTLLKKGLITVTALVNTKHEALTLQEELKNNRNELKNISAELKGLQKVLKEQDFSVHQELSETQRQIEQLQKHLEIQSMVKATQAGRVIEVRLDAGDYVVAGQPLAALESLKNEPQNLELSVYLSMYEGKRVKPGMPIRIVPSVIKIEEDGFILGQVDYVSTFPISQQAVVRVIRNQHLANMLTLNGPVYEARGTLKLDPRTRSGFAWSTGKGPDLYIHSGTFCNVMITVKKLRPIELLLPSIRRLLGQSVSPQSKAP